MTILNVPDMHCSKCVERTTKAHNEAGLKTTMNLEDKTETIEGSAADVEKAKAELDDIGFDAT